MYERTALARLTRIEPKGHRSLPRWIAGGIVLAVLGSACTRDPVTFAYDAFPVTFIVTNNLLAPVTISINGTPYLGLNGGGSASLTVSSSAQWLTWVSAKPMDSRGQPILDDVGEVRIAVAGISRQLDITNVINGQTHITARIFNLTGAPVSIGVHDGSSVSCASELPPKSGAVAGYTQIGYYKLLPATELRAYREPTGCSGPYVAWSPAQLREFQSGSGVLNLVLEAAP